MYRSPFLFRLFYPDLLWRVTCPGQSLYLTFDDGPMPGPTDFVLDTLSRFNAKASFFSIGDNVQKHPGVFQRILREGHLVGNHTFNHLNGWQTAAETYRENVQSCQVEIERYVHQDKKFFRPPYGKITRLQSKLLREYCIVMWDVLTNDFDREKAPEKSLFKTLRYLRPGSIIVLHDSLKAEKNLRYILPRLMEGAIERGYRFNRLDEN